MNCPKFQNGEYITPILPDEDAIRYFKDVATFYGEDLFDFVRGEFRVVDHILTAWGVYYKCSLGDNQKLFMVPEKWAKFIY